MLTCCTERKNLAKTAQCRDASEPLNYLSIEVPSGNAQDAGQAAPKMKVKTRPEGLSVSAEDTEPQMPSGLDATSAEMVIGLQVRRRSLELFSLMFKSTPTTKGSTKWDDFVGAMLDAGCSATHNGGSAVKFADEKNDRGTIDFHRPHPEPSIDLIKLRSMGKRLTKRFGWTLDSFEELGKGKDRKG